MNDPHVHKLHYKVITADNVDYNNAPPLVFETDDFKIELQNDKAVIELKAHFGSVMEAKGLVDKYLSSWNVLIGLQHDPDSLQFLFHDSDIVDRTPIKTGSKNAALNVLSSEHLNLTEKVEVHSSYGNFPDPPKSFRKSLEVEMMYERFKIYKKGRESLLGMAYWCLSVFEYSSKGLNKAAKKYHVSNKVLSKLSMLCSNKGDLSEARKLKGKAGSTPLEPGEKKWIESVIKRLIKRVGECEYDPNAILKEITMSDLPVLKKIKGSNPMIILPHGGPGARFDPSELVQHIKSSSRDYIIQGQQECVLPEHTKPHSLDYWLRTNFAKTPDTKQATNDVIDQLVETGLFEVGQKLHCPDSGRPCKGIKLKSH